MCFGDKMVANPQNPSLETGGMEIKHMNEPQVYKNIH